MKHKTEDYKLSAVKYYLSNSFSLDYVMYVIFLVVKKQSLTRWVKRYNEVKKKLLKNKKSLKEALIESYISVGVSLALLR
jgi:transposase-like protein